MDEPPLALVGPGVAHRVGLAAGRRGDVAVAGRTRSPPPPGMRVVERFEVMRVSTPAVYRFLPFTRRGLVAELRDSTAAADGDAAASGRRSSST